ncbi:MULTISPECIES: SUKH-4 family immunity protein [unclassified Streptomyces]|uniref:SUKH-4 family immunity protein n=1 Tax=unclassified Streptomyces TaxID=2593676 RepID=UPI0037203750|nr:SUKH-4 family immunity protein [Streptomyces sp. NBC_01176]WSS89932.1 SUKH-4 family immunity protein [Streptomyces sp. NBC_01176]
MGWFPYDSIALASLGVGEEVARALSGRGLPADCNRMFVRDSGRELSVRDLPQGRAVFLGAFEDGVNTYWLLIDSGEVWMVRGYEGDVDHQYGLVNSSVVGLQRILDVWEGFVFSGRNEAEDDYEDFVEDVIGQARQSDPDVFEDEDSWWSRVFEEVELGALGPEETSATS